MPQAIVASPPVATEYVTVQPKLNASGRMSPDELAAFQRDVALQAQGEAVGLFDDMPSLTAALSFATIYDIADEAVFRLPDGQLILLFDHQSKATFRPKEVNETVWKEVIKLKKNSTVVHHVSGPKSEVVLDLASVWSRTKEHDNIVARTKLFIQSLVKSLKPGISIRLHGDLPNLPLLMAIYLVRPYGHTILFEDASGGRVTLFS